jgi:hypothetical protein
VLTDVLVLGLARASNGLILAGMTTEPDPVTGLRWVRPTASGAPLALDDLRYADGNLVQMGDVVRLDLQPTQTEPPFVEAMLVNWQAQPLQRVRTLTNARRRTFFPKHLDPAPGDVLARRQRSLCLIKPDTVEALFARDPETERFEARLIFTVGRLRNEDGLPVGDLFWRAWGAHQLGDEEYIEFDQATLEAELGPLYLAIGLGPRGGPLVIGVHPTINYHIGLE